INHSMGNILGVGRDANENAVTTMHAIADEVVRQLHEHGIERADVVLSALGNGTNTLGIAEQVKRTDPTVRVVAYEPFAAGVGYSLKRGREAFWALLEPSDSKKGKTIAENKDFTL